MCVRAWLRSVHKPATGWGAGGSSAPVRQAGLQGSYFSEPRINTNPHELKGPWKLSLTLESAVIRVNLCPFVVEISSQTRYRFGRGREFHFSSANRASWVIFFRTTN